VDSSGATIDFLLSAEQGAFAAERFLAKALGRQNNPVPRVINTDGHSAYPSAIVRLKAEGNLTRQPPGERQAYFGDKTLGKQANPLAAASKIRVPAVARKHRC
jgi:transposase-like protein